MIAGELGLSLDQALAFEKRHGDQFHIVYKPGLIYEHIDLNLDNPILADKRVRQALLYGLDREAISQQLFEGRQPVAHTCVNPLDWVHSDEVPTLRLRPGRRPPRCSTRPAGGRCRTACGTTPPASRWRSS